MKELLKQVTLTEDQRYLEKGFVKFLHDHSDYVKNHESTTSIPLEPALSYKWKGDLFGLFNELGVSPNYYRIAMIINGLDSPSSWDGEIDLILIPNPSLIDDFLVTHTTRQS